MPLDATRISQFKGHLIHEDILQFYDLLVGNMLDQPVTIMNDLYADNSIRTSGNLRGGTLTVDDTATVRGDFTVTYPKQSYLGGPTVVDSTLGVTGVLNANGGINGGSAITNLAITSANNITLSATGGSVAAMSGTAFVGSGSVPTGGTTGQVLTKSSNANYAYSWATPSGGALSWPLLAPDGSVTAPQYSFASNNQAGLYYNGVNAVGITAGGIARALFGGVITFYSPLQWGTDSVSDVGASGANRPRDLWVGRNAQVAGTMLVGGGAAATTWAGVYLNGTIGGLSVAYAVYANGSFDTAVTNIAATVFGTMSFLASTRTVTEYDSFRSGIATVGAGVTITTSAGLRATNMGKSGVTNAYGVYIDAQSGATTANMGLRNEGTTRLTGRVGINTDPWADNTRYVAISGVLSVFNGTMSLDNGMGVGPNTWTMLNVGGNLTGAATQQGMYFRVNGDATGTAQITGISVQIGTANGSYNAPSLAGLYIDGPIPGSGTTMGTVRGINVVNQGGASRTNAYGLYLQATSGASADNISLYNLGTSMLGGNVGIGTSPVAYSGLIFQPTLSGANQFAFYAPLTFSTSGTGNLFAVYLQPTFASSSRTVAAAASVYVDAPTVGASVTVTSMFALYAANQGKAGITNAYGVYIEAQAGAATTNVGLYNAGVSQFMNGIGIGLAGSKSVGINFQMALSGGVNQWGIYDSPVFGTDCTGQGAVLEIHPNTAAGTHTIGGLIGVNVGAPNLGAGTTVSNSYGMYIGNMSASGVVAAYGIQVALPASASSVNIGIEVVGSGGTGNPAIQVGNSAFINGRTSAGTSYPFLCYTGDNWVALYCGTAGLIFTNYANTVRIGAIDNNGAASFRTVQANPNAGSAAVGISPGDILANRGNGTAVYYFVDTTHYIYMASATEFLMSGGNLTVSGSICAGGTVYVNASKNQYLQEAGAAVRTMVPAGGFWSFEIQSGGYAAISAAAFNVNSTLKNKRDLLVITPAAALAQVLDSRVQPLTYTYLDDVRYLGFTAEEMVQVVPEVVSLDAHGDPLTINYGALVPVLWGAVRELSDQVKALEAKLAA